MSIDTRDAAVEVPPLRPGDRLTRAEFERRWEAMPELKRAELIDGVVHMAAAVSVDHGDSHFDLNGWLWYYRCQTPGVAGSDNASIRFDDDNEPQPDGHLRILETHGGRAGVDPDRYLNAGPELVCEVSRSSASYDLGAKLTLYRRFGVPEYVVWRVDDRAVDWFVLRNGVYQRLTPGADGVLRSEVFPGLWLDPAALVAGDVGRLIAVAQGGHASPEHAAFVSDLRSRAVK